MRLRLRDEQAQRQVLRDGLEIEAERRAVEVLHRGIVDAVMVAPAELDGVERRIRLMEEARERRAVALIERVADGDRESMYLAVICEGLHLIGKCLDDLLCLLRLRVLHEDDELVAAIAADDLVVAEALDEVLGQSAQGLVTRHVAVQVIDELEAVEIEADERAMRSRMRLEPVRDLLVEAHAVEDARQRIVLGHVGEILLRGRDLLCHRLENAAELADVIGMHVVQLDIVVALADFLRCLDDELQALRQAADHVERQERRENADRDESKAHLHERLVRAVVDLLDLAQIDEVHAVSQALDARDALLTIPGVGDHRIVRLARLRDLVGRIHEVDVLVGERFLRRILHGARGIAQDDHTVLLSLGRFGVEPVDEGLEVQVDTDDRDHDAVLVDGPEIRDNVAVQVRRIVRLRPSGLALIHQVGKGNDMARSRLARLAPLLGQDIIEHRVVTAGSLPERRDILRRIVEIVRADDVEIGRSILEIVVDRLCQALLESRIAQLIWITDLARDGVSRIVHDAF